MANTSSKKQGGSAQTKVMRPLVAVIKRLREALRISWSGAGFRTSSRDVVKLRMAPFGHGSSQRLFLYFVDKKM